MAISCCNIMKLSDDSSNLHNVIVSEGKNFINHYKDAFNLLKISWKGSDACNNLKVLFDEYNIFVTFIENAEKKMVSVHNGPVLDLQRENKGSGGSIQVGSEISFAFSYDSLELPPATFSAWVAESFKNDVETFKQLLSMLDKYKASITEARNVLLTAQPVEIDPNNYSGSSNWLSGGEHQTVNKVLNDLSEAMDNLKSRLSQVCSVLDTVLSNKSQLM